MVDSHARHTSEIFLDDRSFAAWSHLLLDAPVTDRSFGVKDVIDVAGMPTGCGFAPFRDTTADVDAGVVARLRQAGWSPVGKTETAQFAFADPPPTVSPVMPDRTPGGSSTGSAVAVARKHVRMALATQTGGSTVRPAAYCGVVGAKPTFGVLPTDGVWPVAPSMDTIGIICDKVATASEVLEALGVVEVGSVALSEHADTREVRISRYHTVAPLLETSDAVDAWNIVVDALEDVVDIATVALPSIDLPKLVDAHRRQMAVEAWDVHGSLMRSGYGAYFGPKIQDLLDLGEGISANAETTAATSGVLSLAEPFGASVPDTGVLIMPATVGAPPARQSTGSSRLAMPWTVLGMPVVAVPWRFRLPNGQLVVGAVQIVARHDDESGALRAAALIERILIERTLCPSTSE